ncbi:hypothetical protein [Microtetraspora niveoalba]|uniref:hypothetical protein n=1 Tax=Microtetraspora niveoalba TaxID=46175 RepID=UPI0008368F79|nr:hypothetical protein [Microtetraspora niveoalba]
MGREAGVLCGLAGTSDAVEATVVVTAVRETAAILTSDPGDLRALLDAARPGVRPALIVL